MDYTQDEATKKEVEKYCQLQTMMESARSQTENHWQECYDYIVPRKSDVISMRTQGDKRGNELFDSTAINANQLLSSALHGMLTNPATKFFELVMGDPELDNDEEVKEWLQIVADRMFVVMNNSNFQTEVHETYIDLGAIGTACMFVGEHDDHIVHFNTRAMKEIFVSENNLGLIDRVHRKFSWKPKHIVQEFGEKNCHPFVMEQYKKGNEEDWTVIHAVHPNYEKDGKQPFKSCYFLKDQKIKLNEKGFNEFPYAIPRWTKTSGEVYGRGPGMDSLPDIKMINSMQEAIIKGAQKTIDPPVEVEDDGVVGRVRLTPSGITYKRPGSAPIRPLITDARIDFGFQAVDRVRAAIRAAFFVDQLQLNEGPQMTAAEVFQRSEEKMRLMGPVLGRQHFEFLRPVIERVFGIMSRKGMFPPAPESIQGKKFDVRYSSLIAKAQRMGDAENVNRAIATLAPMLQLKPETADLLNGDEYARYVMSLYGAPMNLLNKQKEVQEIREGRAKAQEQAAAEMQEQHQAEVAGKVGPAAAQMMMAQKGMQQ
jgi:hypothetical protein